MPHYQGKKFYFEVSNPPEVLPRQRMRVQGMYAPIHDRNVLMRRFDLVLNTRALNPSGALLEAALAAERAERVEMAAYEDD